MSRLNTVVDDLLEVAPDETSKDPFSPAERSDLDGIKKNVLALGDTRAKRMVLVAELKSLAADM